MKLGQILILRNIYFTIKCYDIGLHKKIYTIKNKNKNKENGVEITLE